MAFFEIQDPNYNSDQIEDEILASLNKRKFSYEQEEKVFRQYYIKDTWKKFCCKPITQFKILFNHLQRWSVRIAYKNQYPVFSLNRWNKQIKRDLADLAIKNHKQNNLEPREQLEHLLYDRFLLIQHIENIERENHETTNYINKLHKTWSWKITTPLRKVKANFGRLINKVL